MVFLVVANALFSFTFAVVVHPLRLRRWETSGHDRSEAYATFQSKRFLGASVEDDRKLNTLGGIFGRDRGGRKRTEHAMFHNTFWSWTPCCRGSFAPWSIRVLRVLPRGHLVDCLPRAASGKQLGNI